MSRGMRWGAGITLSAVLLFGAVSVTAQTPGQYAIPRFVVGTGGATGLSGGTFGLNATAGQPFAGGGSGGQFGLAAGFQQLRSSGASGSNTIFVPAGVLSYPGGW